jgi:glycosyltransferase involved in cell wall biosynthesis
LTRVSAAPTFCFVIPCFNEENNVGPTVHSVRDAIGGRGDYEIILVNDASTDRTLQRMHALAAGDARIRVLDNPTNLGFGGSYKRGASVATATYVMMLPGDDGFPGQSIAEILSHAGEADVIIPIVTNPGTRGWFRAFASKGFTTLLNWTFWLKVGYYNGAALQRNDLLRSIQITTDSFAYQAEALVKLIARGATYKHCHVRIQERAAGRSSALSLKNQLAVWKTILHLIAVVGLFRRFPLMRRPVENQSRLRAFREKRTGRGKDE